MGEISTATSHFVNGHAIRPPFAAGLERAMFGMGCFWGAERLFWQLPGVYSTAVGYAGGTAIDPDYRQVCTGRTGHAEVVLVVYDPKTITYKQLLQVFWESHDPTQGMRQGNDIGTQYRSAILCFNDTQRAQAVESMRHYRKRCSGLAEARSRPRLATRRRSTTPRTITSSTWRRIRTGTAGSGVWSPIQICRVTSGGESVTQADSWFPSGSQVVIKGRRVVMPEQASIFSLWSTARPSQPRASSCSGAASSGCYHRSEAKS